MAISAKIVLVAALSLICAAGARAQQAASSDRCEGTLCDLYYGAGGNTAAMAKPASTAVPGVPAGATPLMAPSGTNLLSGNPLSRWFGGGSSDGTRPTAPPSEPESANNSYMHLGSGGLLGDKQQRCTGTLCDVYYGSSPAVSEASGSAQRQADATPAAAAAEPVIAYHHVPHESETRPKCASTAADPWRCFRK